MLGGFPLDADALAARSSPSYAQHMERGASIIAGLKAAALGSLLGTAILTLITVVIGFQLIGEDMLAAVLVTLAPFFIGFCCAALGLLVFGLPLTAILKRREGETRQAYVVGGVLAGALAPQLFSLLIGEWDLSLGLVSGIGALTGGFTGQYWWRFAREPMVGNDTQELIAEFE